MVEAVETQARGEAVCRRRAGDEAPAEPGLAGGGDDAAAGTVDAVRAAAAKDGSADGMARDLRAREPDAIAHRIPEPDSATACMHASIDRSAHEPRHRGGRVDRRELGAPSVSPVIEVDQRARAHGARGARGRARAERGGAPRTPRRAPGGDAS